MRNPFFGKPKPTRQPVVLTKENVCAAIDRAVEVMAADPSKIGTGALARDKNGTMVSVVSPKACSFCTLGFVARELGMDTDAWPDLYGPLALVGIDNLATIWQANDDGVIEGRPLAGALELSAAATACRENI